MYRTATRLADGRELIYFDSGRGADRGTTDHRDLAPADAYSEMRLDPVTDEWVVVAAHRQTRTHLPAATACPLCPSTPRRLTEVPGGDYEVLVFENRFPSLAYGGPPIAPSVDDQHLFRRAPGVGRCEVVCFSSDHDTSFAELSAERVRLIVDTWADRASALGRLAGVREVFAFENRGPEIGVTLSHPHGQIYGYPFVTPRTERMLNVAQRHAERTGGNLFADVLRAECDAQSRVVAATAHWTAFVPAAARWPVEVHLYPNRRRMALPELDDAERDDFAVLYLDLLRRLDALYDSPLPYMAGWFQAPDHPHRDQAYLHLRVVSPRRAHDRLKYLAGSEALMGAFINDVTPEHLAQRLRDTHSPASAPTRYPTSRPA